VVHEVATDSLRATTWLGAGDRGDFRYLDFAMLRGGDEMILAQLFGVGGQHTGDIAVEAARMVLAHLLDPSRASIAMPSADTHGTNLAAWIPALVNRAPLPEAPAELLPELAARVGDVLAQLNERRAAVQAFGVLVHARGRTLTIDRRSDSAVHLVRGESATVVARAHTLQEQARALGQALPTEYPAILLSALQRGGNAEPPIELTMQPDDRVVIVPTAVYPEGGWALTIIDA
jgi:hypothetical protein